MTEKPIFDAGGALTREFLAARGYCCENGCRNCPYGFRKVPEHPEYPEDPDVPDVPDVPEG